MSHGEKARAVHEAGYDCKNDNSARSVADGILARPHVQRVMEKLKAAVPDKIAYGIEQAMKELDAAALFARTTNNATALARVTELKARIAGLIVDKKDLRVAAGFRVEIEGIEDE